MMRVSSGRQNIKQSNLFGSNNVDLIQYEDEDNNGEAEERTRHRSNEAPSNIQNQKRVNINHAIYHGCCVVCIKAPVAWAHHRLTQQDDQARTNAGNTEQSSIRNTSLCRLIKTMPHTALNLHRSGCLVAIELLAKETIELGAK